MNFKPVASKGPSTGPGLPVMFLVLVVIITSMLWTAFLPGRTLFSNDGPLARLMSDCHSLPDSFHGVWEDLNSVGYREQGALPDITCGLRLLLHPILFSKFYVAVAILILGMGAWTFFRQLKLAPAACILGGVAAALNSDFFSTACWGVASHPITVGMAFFAMAALLNTSAWRSWLYALLAGAAVGIGVTEGADVGVIFSIYVAIFGMYNAWIAEGPRVKNLALGAGRIAVVAIFAGLIAAQAIFALVNTQIEGVAGMQQDEQTRESHWQWATRWSLPKREALGLFVPGLFGYRLDVQNGAPASYYWGALGRSPAWEKYLASGQEGKKPVDILRQTGSGIYAGVTVVLVAIWAAFQAFRRKESVFNLTQRKWLWFWTGVGVIALLFGFGRYAPFYRLLYALPYFSTIRNPVKFLTIVNFALVILFAYGVDGLWRTYLAPAAATLARRSPAAIRFDKLWMRGCLVALGVALVGWLIYANSREALQVYLESVQFFPARAHQIAGFSIGQVGWFILFFIAAAGLMSLFMNGHFAGARARWGAVMLGLVLVADLGLADRPWIISWDYKSKYATNPIIDMLRDKPYEHRVAIIPFHGRPVNGPSLEDLYRYEWAQQAFQYYNIQSYDIVQLPRVPQDMDAFRKATFFDGSTASRALLIRRWELTNTRYLLGSVDVLNGMNTEIDPLHQNRFRIIQRFNLAPKPNVDRSAAPLEKITAELSPEGNYALYEFTGAIPRAKLFSAWQVNTNMSDSLHQMLSPSFNPMRDLLVESGLPDNAKQGTNENAGTVDFASYSPKDVVLDANATSSCILLLNDRIDPTWHVTVDGKPSMMLRCNYFMRGVYLEPGTHRVEFRFHAPSEALHLSVAAIFFSVLLIGVAVVTRPREEKANGKSPTPNRVEKEFADKGKNNGKVTEPVSNAPSPSPKRKSQTPAGKGKR